MTSSPPSPRPQNERTVRTVIAVMALIFIAMGLAIRLLQDALGLPAGTARMVSTALLLVGIADTLLLYFWDRIFKRR